MIDLPTAISRLGTVRLFDYFKNRSMPDFVEPLVADLVDSFKTRSEAERRGLLTAVSPEVGSVLGWYARKLAGRAVRDRSRTDLCKALTALAISASREDARDVLPPLSLLYNSALHLKQDPKSLFEEAANMSTEPVVELFEAFLRRPERLKSIGTFGFSEGVGPHGFDYLPLLPEYGGPTPV